jgi:hypothetical protein
VGRRAARPRADAASSAVRPTPGAAARAACALVSVDELRALDPDHLTPMQALALVARLSAERALTGAADAGGAR